MIEKNLKKFKKLLEIKKQELEEKLKKFAKKDLHVSGDWKSNFPHFGNEEFDIEEAPNEVTEYINRLPIEHILELRLKAVNEALKRIKKDTYGKCKNCGKEKNIPLKRLEALPETKICLQCKTKKI